MDKQRVSDSWITQLELTVGSITRLRFGYGSSLARRLQDILHWLFMNRRLQEKPHWLFMWVYQIATVVRLIDYRWSCMHNRVGTAKNTPINEPTDRYIHKKTHIVVHSYLAMAIRLLLIRLGQSTSSASSIVGPHSAWSSVVDTRVTGMSVSRLHLANRFLGDSVMSTSNASIDSEPSVSPIDPNG